MIAAKNDKSWEWEFIIRHSLVRTPRTLGVLLRLKDGFEFLAHVLSFHFLFLCLWGMIMATKYDDGWALVVISSLRSTPQTEFMPRCVRLTVFLGNGSLV